MKIRTAELTGAALDWAVAKCEDINLFETEGWIYMDGTRAVFRPTTDWRQGGLIIEREEISVEHGRAEFRFDWIAYKLGLPHEDNPEGGPTPLIAAMRCYVASKLGDEIEVPDELL